MNSLKRNMPLIHPGEFLRTELIEANELTITEVAALLKVSRQALSNIINQKADISPEMAMRIATVFGGTRIFGSGYRQSMTLKKLPGKSANLS